MESSKFKIQIGSRKYEVRNMIFSFLFLASYFLAISSCGPKKAEPPPVPVETAKVELGEIREVISYAGSVKGENEAIVFPRAAGKITKKILNEGDKVKKNGVIAYFERDEVGFKFKPAPIVSPIDGTVGRIYVEIGQTITPQTPAALVVGAGKKYAKMNVDEKYISKLAIGKDAEVATDAYPDIPLGGKITKIGDAIDLQTRTVPIEIEIEDDAGKLKSGMFARINLILTRHDGVPIVPKDAIVRTDGADFVFIVDNGVAKKALIKAGIIEGTKVEVTQGLLGGEEVVTLGQQRLADGLRVIK